MARRTSYVVCRCAVSLALVRGDEAVLGVIDVPLLATRYTATRDGGARANGRRIRTSTTTRLREAMVAIGDYAVGPGAESRNNVRLALTAKLAAEVQRVRMTGSAALDLAWLAEGKPPSSTRMAATTTSRPS
ncbi:hypothetical protein GKC29_22440 [Micromonospora sp. WMMC415]|nr:hypothetical protein GKC29_22440 [Micromonospora sp. WMMC415]